MVIFDAGTEPPAIQASIDRVLETVRTTGGTPGQVDRWGRRPFAYEVKHRREGYYVLIDFAGEVATVNDLDRMLSLADEVVRHRVIRLPEAAAKRSGPSKPPPPVVVAEEKPAPAAPVDAEEAAAEPEAAPAPSPSPSPAAAAAAAGDGDVAAADETSEETAG
jgi:small subunit ribosomal protein S6